MIKVILFTAMMMSVSYSFAELSNDDVLNSCHRGTSPKKVWMDSPSTEFFNYVRSFGYGVMETLGATYKICRDRSLKGNVTDLVLEKKNSPRVKKYIKNLRTAIYNLIENCRPGMKCHNQRLQIPLEGLRNDKSVCKSVAPTRWNGMNICVTGKTHKIWIDRPTKEFVSYLMKEKWYGQFRALGIAYRICRGSDTAKNPAHTNDTLRDIFRNCPPKGACRVGLRLPLEGLKNRQVLPGFSCNS